MDEVAVRRKRQLVTKTITVPGNLQIACDQFNSRQYFECHESLEEIWQEETGDVRDFYKGLIQVAAAFVHITRENCTGARRLLTTGIGYLAPYRSEPVLGFDIDEVCLAAEDCLRQVEELCPGGLGRFSYGHIPVYICDEELIPASARHWDAWGFDREGNALSMEIDVVE